MSEEVRPAIVWKTFEDAIGRKKPVYYDEVPYDSYLLTKLPISGTVLILRTTYRNGDSTHASMRLQSELIDDLKDQPARSEFTVDIYFPNYALGQNCVQRLNEVVEKLRDEKGLTVKLHVKVYMVDGLKSKKLLYESRAHWNTDLLSLENCHSLQACVDFFRSVLSLLSSYSQGIGRIHFTNIDEDVQCQVLYRLLATKNPDIHEAKGVEPPGTTINVDLDSILCAIERCEAMAGKISSILDGEEKFDFKQTLEIFKVGVRLEGHPEIDWEEVCDDTTQEMSTAIVWLPNDKTKVYKGRLEDGHVEESYIEDIKNMVEKWNPAEPIKFRIYQTLAPSEKCADDIVKLVKMMKGKVEQPKNNGFEMRVAEFASTSGFDQSNDEQLCKKRYSGNSLMKLLRIGQSAHSDREQFIGTVREGLVKAQNCLDYPQKGICGQPDKLLKTAGKYECDLEDLMSRVLNKFKSDYQTRTKPQKYFPRHK